MVREVLSISIGQGGIQLGNAVWNQYNAEHGINVNGTRRDNVVLCRSEQFQTFYEETTAAQYVPRNLFVDLEPTVLDEVRNGPCADLFHSEFLVNSAEDAANNFARGYYTVGTELMESVNDQLRKMVDRCENPQGFMVTHSVGGGTGSGLGSLILERLATDYRKKSKIGFEIYPSPNISTCIVEPYNGLLATHVLLDTTDISVVLDNEALYTICQTKLAIERPSYANINRIIAKVVSSVTADLRFDCSLNCDMNEYQTNLVPFPRLHFMTTSFAPLISAATASAEGQSFRHITTEALRPTNFFVKYSDFDIVDDKYMAISLNYRGEAKSKEVNAVVQWIKQTGKVSFVEWCPTGFKIGMNDVMASPVPNDDLAMANRTCTMISNNVAIRRLFTDRLMRKYDMMYSQRAYVHWYVGEGMEEGEFSEAREDLGFLEKDYLDIISSDDSDTSSLYEVALMETEDGCLVEEQVFVTNNRAEKDRILGNTHRDRHATKQRLRELDERVHITRTESGSWAEHCYGY